MAIDRTDPLTSGTSDDELAATLPGFTSHLAHVNGIGLHYVMGGQGKPLVLLAGWPQTWWHYRHVMPAFAAERTVIAIDIRGQGGSAMPQDGYDKKTMGDDVAGLVKQLGLGKIDLVGHDIGAMVAFSFAVNHTGLLDKLVMLDVSHPFELFRKIPMLPPPGAYDAANPNHPKHLWWFAFNQVPNLPEALLAGRAHLFLNWIFDHSSRHPEALSALDRSVYARAYEQQGAIRASNAWYQAFDKDIDDMATYPNLEMPVLGIGSTGNAVLPMFLKAACTNVSYVELPDTGHYMAEESPEATVAALRTFVD